MEREADTHEKSVQEKLKLEVRIQIGKGVSEKKI